MEIRGQCQLPASPAAVWHYLATPEQISQCVPGLVSWETLEPDKRFQLWLRWAFAPASQPLVPLALTWMEQQPPESLRLQMAAQLGPQSVQAVAQLTLHWVSPQQTQLDFVVTIDTANRFTQQIIRSRSLKVIDAFFSEMQRRLAAES